jgi:solute:Na+ symporter, SSS family
VNAWCEVVAMLSSFTVSIVILILARNDIHMSTHVALLVTIAFTTVCWLLTAFLGPETDRKTLVEFYRKARPFGPGWKKVREEAGISEKEAKATGQNIPMALLGWVAGCTTIWSSLFAVGNFLYGRMTYAFILFGVFVVSGTALIFVVNKLWTKDPVSPSSQRGDS